MRFGARRFPVIINTACLRLLSLVIGIICPATVLASDFVVLQVGLMNLLLTALVVFLGFKAAAARDRQTLGIYLFLIMLLTFFGIVMVLDEAAHMSDLDSWGMIGMVSIAGLLAVVISLVSFNSAENTSVNNDEEK